LATPANEVAVTLTASRPGGSEAQVDVRGFGSNGKWMQWVPAAATGATRLPESVTKVQARLTLRDGAQGAAPTVSSLAFVADNGAAANTAPQVTPMSLSYQVYATREGLVGGTTANGHVITENDQFVALPSSRALDADGKGDYSVRLCTDAGRCAVVPVWDVGPWNTDDDYWNAAPPRQNWTDVPQGTPEAQVAFQRKYHDGEDGFGRDVKNPAGVDVADGTFHALGLGDNSYVTVDYLWTGRAGEAPGDVHLGTADSPQAPVVIRSTPANGGTDEGLVGNDAQVDVQCHVAGDAVTGSHGSSTDWLRIDADRYVPAAWVVTSSAPPAC
jgi:hypothetical protein